MPKLKLNMEQLDVASFETAAWVACGRAGTVKGRVDDATIGGYTCRVNEGTCGAFCIENGGSINPYYPCGGNVQTGVPSCFQYQGCMTNACQTGSGETCNLACQTCQNLCPPSQYPVCY